MEIINIITLWLHYLATVMWIGGMAFNLLVLRPSMIVIDQNQRPILGTKVLKRFIIFAWLSIAVLILTGISIAVSRGAFEDIFSTTYGIVLLSKHFVTLIMVLIVAWISFVLSAKLSSFAPKPETILLLVKTNLSLGILVLLLTSVLRGA
ncbi:MAG: CopD family protein [Candidatus Methanoperedens sp.]|nr:CopD family protein [Candidatus Methanoperedens sp.]MCZ7405503.1 CopD family protein [Candidatus Methanoperedens sp.]